MVRGDLYRQGTPEIGLFIERNTDIVPGDGRYYVLFHGEVLGAFRSLKQAQDLYRRKRQEVGFHPKPVQEKKPYTEDVDNYFHAWETYWSQSSSHRRGGKGGRGGV